MEARKQLWKAGKTYLAAAELLPVDDEKHVGKYIICVENEILTQGESGFLQSALEAFLIGGTPLSETVPLMERIRYGIPLTQEIWQSGGMDAQIRNFQFGRTAAFEIEAREKLADGRVSLHECLSPEWASPGDVFAGAAGPPDHR